MEKLSSKEEAALVKRAKSLIELGYGEFAALKMVRSKISDADERQRIMAQVIPNFKKTSLIASANSSPKIATSEKDKIAARKLRNAQYVLDDFRESINHLFRTGIMLIVIAILMAISTFVLGGNNLIFVIFSLLGTGLFFATQRTLNWFEVGNIYLLGGLYGFLLILELATGGMPDPFFSLSIDTAYVPRIIAALLMINLGTPLIYWLLKISLFYFIVRLWQLKTKLDQVPASLRQQLNIKQ